MTINDFGDKNLIGLTDSEVELRIQQGKSNFRELKLGKSVWEIIKSNLFTRINFLLGFFLILVLATASYINAAFGLLIIFNSITGIVQELRARRTLNKLEQLTKAKVLVRRAKKTLELDSSAVVVDDLIELGPGQQLFLDGTVLTATGLMVDESMLTGESDPVQKSTGDEVYSGSFVVAGFGVYKVQKVAAESFSGKLVATAGKFSLVNSEIMNGINSILKWITWLIIPVGILTVYAQFFILPKHYIEYTDTSIWEKITKSILGVTAALVPMIPEGLILITTIAFAMGVIKLGAKKCLVQELPAIEGLARVDTVCVDKTGTLTENKMQLKEVKFLTDSKSTTITALANFVKHDPFPNDSMKSIGKGLISLFNIEISEDDGWQPENMVPFSSDKKWSAITFVEHGSWIIGAPEVLLSTNNGLLSDINEINESGLRVLVLAHTTQTVTETTIANIQLKPVALIVLQQQLRSDVKPTLEFFSNQNVAVKVISGDNSVSISAVTQDLSLQNSRQVLCGIDFSEDWSKFKQQTEIVTVFGRVTPNQKLDIVTALQENGHTVAMTGDGVNDVLALKQADIGVAMGTGSAATRAVAQIILLNNKFSIFPELVAEGRRIIGNIERVAKLFLTKTIYSITLALLIGFTQLFKDYKFPFQPIHITIAAWFTIGIPAFILSLAANNERAQPNFAKRILKSTIPYGVIIGIAVYISFLLFPTKFSDTSLTLSQTSTACLITLLIPSIWVLGLVARPYDLGKVLLLGGCCLGYVVIFTFPYTRKLLELNLDNRQQNLIAVMIGIIATVIIELVWIWSKKYLKINNK